MRFGIKKAVVGSRAYAIRPYNSAIFLHGPFRLHNSDKKVGFFNQHPGYPMIFNSHSSANNPTTPIYEIRLQGHLHPRWLTQFPGMQITQESDGDTLLTGPIIDQSALYGLLRKLRDVGIPLLSVFCIVPKKSAHDMDDSHTL